MVKQLIAVLAVVGILAGNAWADSVHIGGTTNITNQGGQGGQGGKGGDGGNAYSSAHSSANSLNVNVNKQEQSMGQGQGQDQSQRQRQSADNKGNNQSVNVDSSLIPGVAVAPGLAAGGSQICLGSFSIGVSGPMAGLAFGKTVQDKGCEKRQLFILLHNTKDPRAAAVLDSLYREAMGEEVKQASLEPGGVSAIAPAQDVQGN
jgi:hypothetical protein